MKPHLILALLATILFSTGLFAQDIIMEKNNNLIKCKIREIGLDEIKYNLPEYSTDVLFSIDKDKIIKIIFENGQEMEFQKEMTNPANYIDNRKNIIKIDFLSPLTGNTTFAYERSLRPSRSVEATLGIIGLGIDEGERNAGGVFTKFGYKFIKDPDFYLRGIRYAHILKGSYIKPEIALGFFNHDTWMYRDWGNGYSSEKKRESVFSGTVQLVIGKQWIMDNAFAVDFFAGIGYGFSTGESYTSYHYGYSVMDESFPLAFSTGLKIGYLFK
ncbi:MAG: hypothetical protein K0B15_01750 [Lentimicrobium sp.]|nr:hypothetical protein [Lentimicrobium sp.]